ncbi:MAG: tetratricopeptide repeat protein [Rhodospirillaceae bacterium]|nr:tetratricopeptide repeat protein [Rhodospirillaceae bacterium]MDE0619876.1 tetratricopeptide repeat protein [Rhodospirillaceae bacterium]
MAVTARKYNPGFLSFDELVAIFCVRTAEYDSLIEALRECSGSANTHQLVIGPRGSGKTSLLLRVAAEVIRDADLSARFFPIVFAEESYEVSTAGEFWLECLSRLADQAPAGKGGVDLHLTFGELRAIQDDRTLEARCLGVLQDFADREEKRLVLIVENLNMMFRDMGDDDAGWRLRKALQTEPRVVLLASATSRFEQMSDPKQALYELFRVIRLHPLDTEGCATLWQTVSGQARAPQTIQALRILTGGSPRLLTIVARFGANLSFRELMADLLDLVDDHTEYFKSHLDALPAQERKVYLALADLWKPASAREIADRARLGTSKCSAQLARLVDKGAVEVSGGSARRKLYYLTERLYNIYYLMRRARGPAPLIDALIRFMEAYYSTDELRAFGARMAREALGFDGGALALYRMAFERLVELPSLEAHRAELISLAPPALAYAPGEFSGASQAPSPARELLGKALALAEGGRLQEAIAAWDEVDRRFGASDKPADLDQVSLALVNKGKALGVLGKADEASAVWDDVVRRFGADNGIGHPLAVATALASKGGMLGNLGRHTEALAAWNEVARRFGKSPAPGLQTLVASALVGRAVALDRLDRPRETLQACDQVLERFGKSGSPAHRAELAVAMVARGHALSTLNRADEAIDAWSAVVERFGRSDSPRIVEQVASALANIGTWLFKSGRLEEALTAFDGVLRSYAGSDAPILREVVARSFVNRGNVLAALKREAEALSSWQEAIRRFEAGGLQDVAEPHCNALMNRAAALHNAGSPEEALELLADVAERFGADDRPELLAAVAQAQTNRGVLLEQSGRYEEALAVWQQIEDRVGASDEPERVALVAGAFQHRCADLYELSRMEEALATCDRAIDRFGDSNVPAVVDSVAGILLNKGLVLVTAHRNEEALAVWDEIERRFGDSDDPGISKHVASALVSKGTTLAQMNRAEDAVEVWNDVMRRFGENGSPLYREEIATALNNRVLVLDLLDRPEEALEACDEALRRFGSSDEPYDVEAVAQTLVNKGGLLVDLDRTEEGFAAWDEVVRRFEDSDEPALRVAAEMALCRRAEHELSEGRARTAVGLLDRALLPARAGMPASRLQGHLVRAQAHLAEGDGEASTRDVVTALSILPELNMLPREVLVALADLSAGVGLERMCDLIGSSPAGDLLLPLKTALELELGLEPRVAREVEEVAEDIRRELLAGRKDEKQPRAT